MADRNKTVPHVPRWTEEAKTLGYISSQNVADWYQVSMRSLYRQRKEGRLF